jgi:hypothetical protein
MYCPKYNHPIGKNSTNLVTLFSWFAIGHLLNWSDSSMFSKLFDVKEVW